MLTLALVAAFKGKETFNLPNRNAGGHKKQPFRSNLEKKKDIINTKKAFTRRIRWEQG